MSANLLSLLKAAAGEASLTGKLGRWRVAVSQVIAAISGDWLPPATGITAGSRPLVGYDVSGLDAGAQVFVEGGIDELYWWNPLNTAPVDGLNVVKPNGASGLQSFVRESVVVQPSWFVNASTGDDQNPGTNASQPLRTLLELGKRFNGKYVLQDTTITDTGNSTFTNPLALNCRVAAGKTLKFIGAAPTQQSTGSITAAFVAYAPATNVDAKLTDATQTWATQAGRRIRMTSGAASGAITWVMKDLGANVARVGQFVRRSDGLMQTPANGDAYVVETLSTNVPQILVQVFGGGGFYMKDVAITPTKASIFCQVTCGGVGAVYTTPEICILDGCKIGGLVTNFYNSYFYTIGMMVNPTNNFTAYWYNSTVASFGTVFLTGGLYSQAGSRWFVCAHNISQNATIGASELGEIVLFADSSFAIASFGLFDTTGSRDFEAFYAGYLVAPIASGYFFGVATTGTASFRIHPSAQLIYTSKPVMAGSTNDAVVGGLNKAYAALPFFNGYDGATVGTGNGAGFVVYV